MGAAQSPSWHHLGGRRRVPLRFGKKGFGYFGQTRKKKIKLYLAAPRSGATREGGLYLARGLVTRLRCVVCRTGRAVWGFDNEDLRHIFYQTVSSLHDLPSNYCRIFILNPGNEISFQDNDFT